MFFLPYVDWTIRERAFNLVGGWAVRFCPVRLFFSKFIFYDLFCHFVCAITKTVRNILDVPKAKNNYFFKATRGPPPLSKD